MKMLLDKPLPLKTITLRNRIVMPPMATELSVNDVPSDALIDYYRQRAKATGLIIVEHEYVSLEGKASPRQLSMAEGVDIAAYRRLTDAIHSQGAAVIAQVNHAGADAFDDKLPVISASDIRLWRSAFQAKAMTLGDIERIKHCFVNAAVQSKAAGFDGVEIHSAHGYLLNQFYSPLTNLRTDDYNGKTMEGRTRLHGEIIRAVRKAVGQDYIVALRFGACDYMKGGSQIAEIPEAVKRFVDAGVDLIDISGGLSGYMVRGASQPGWFAELSRPAKGAVDVPVILTGGVQTGQDAERLLQEGAADLIGVGRALMQDAGWSERALQHAG